MGSFPATTPNAFTTTPGASRAPTQEAEQGRQLVSSRSLAAQTLACRVPGSKNEQTQPGAAAVNCDPIYRSWHCCVGCTSMFFPSVGRKAYREREGEGGQLGIFSQWKLTELKIAKNRPKIWSVRQCKFRMHQPAALTQPPEWRSQ